MLVSVYTCQNAILFEITCRGSFEGACLVIHLTIQFCFSLNTLMHVNRAMRIQRESQGV